MNTLPLNFVTNLLMAGKSVLQTSIRNTNYIELNPRIRPHSRSGPGLFLQALFFSFRFLHEGNREMPWIQWTGKK